MRTHGKKNELLSQIFVAFSEKLNFISLNHDSSSRILKQQILKYQLW